MVVYKNGNYLVMLDLNDGSKTRVNNKDFLQPEFAESIDLKITNMCNMGCEQCHENSTIHGKHANILKEEFLNTLHPHTELAIGGGNPLEHPQLESFLVKCRELCLVPSMTVHQVHFMQQLEFLRTLRDNKLIYGLGVSVTKPTDELISALKEFPNAVVHLIAGYTPKWVFEELANKGLKILILGYKRFRRGKDLYDIDYVGIDYKLGQIYDLLPKMIDEGWYETISFDNLAINQLRPSRFMTDEEYSRFYMGDDAQFTYYIDAVERKFAKNSTSDVRYDLLDDATEMFNIVRGE